MKLFGSTKNEITKYKNVDNVPHLEITEVVLVHYDIVNKDYQQDSRVQYTYTPNESFGQLLDISPKAFIFLKTFNSEILNNEVWFTNDGLLWFTKPPKI